MKNHKIDEAQPNELKSQISDEAIAGHLRFAEVPTPPILHASLSH